MRKLYFTFGILLAFAGMTRAQCVQDSLILLPERDNTLYEDSAGMLSNGVGEYFFAGRTGEGMIRRGLLYFDVAAAIPAGSVIEEVQLTLNMSRTFTLAPTLSIGLYRCLADWGEGTSDADFNEGQGDSSTVGDATWLHTFFSSGTWTSPGGDFAATPSATAEVAFEGTYQWEGSPDLVTDVQNWLDGATSNFGWGLIGDESSPSNAKRFDSRENANPANRPRLKIVFTPPASPVAVDLGEDTAFCENEPLLLDAYNENATYLWSTGETTPSIFVDSDGTFSVTVTDTTTGCTGTAVDAISVVALNYPVVNISPGPAVEFCEGSSVSLTGSFGGTSQWYLNGVPIPGATSNSYTATEPGNYNMTKTNLNGCSDSSATGTVLSFLPSPEAIFTQSSDTVDLSTSGEVFFTDGSSAASAWCWTFGDGDSSSLQNPVHTYTAPGTYPVTLIAKNECGESDTATSTLFADDLTGQLNSHFPEIKIYSPGGSGVIRCESSSPQEAKLEIFDSAGRSLRWVRFKESVRLAPFHSGMYLAVVTDNANRIAVRFIVN